MPARVAQVSVSRGGLPKRAVAEALLTADGVAGDAHAHPSIHGGPAQAVLLVTGDVVDQLRAAGFPVFAGALGENLTVEGLDRKSLRPGHRYRVGAEAVIALTKRRAPCKALDAYGPAIRDAIWDAEVKAGNPRSAKWGMTGFYAAVLLPGIVRPGDPVELLESEQEPV